MSFDLIDLYDHEIEVATSMKTELSINDLSIIAGEFRKYVRYVYKISITTTFTAKKNKETISKFWADSVYCKEHRLDPRIYQDRFVSTARFIIAEWEDVILALAEDEDVINSKKRDIRKPTLKKAMRKYLPELKVLDARKARKKADKLRKELARTKNAAQQNT